MPNGQITSVYQLAGRWHSRTLPVAASQPNGKRGDVVVVSSGLVTMPTANAVIPNGSIIGILQEPLPTVSAAGAVDVVVMLPSEGASMRLCAGNVYLGASFTTAAVATANTQIGLQGGIGVIVLGTDRRHFWDVTPNSDAAFCVGIPKEFPVGNVGGLVEVTLKSVRAGT